MTTELKDHTISLPCLLCLVAYNSAMDSAISDSKNPVDLELRIAIGQTRGGGAREPLAREDCLAARGRDPPLQLPPPPLGRAKMGEENWRLMTLCLLTAVVALLMVLSIHLHQDVKYWQVR